MFVLEGERDIMKDLKPEEVWDHFLELSKIPRCSGNEGPAREYVKSIAEDHGYETDVDEVGNVLVRKPGEIEDASPLVIQSHLDMVCEKTSDKDHDFSKDPIPIKKEDDWLTADRTTLGADNGIGVAISLAIMEDEGLRHGPLEFLFTVGEETGLDGAKGIKPGYFEGRTLINLDSEEFGNFTIGCAGSGDSWLKIPVEYEESGIGKFFEIKIDGLKGGHSGLDIGEGRANANKIIGKLLFEAYEKKEDLNVKTLRLQDIEGGSKRNTIPKEASAVIEIDGQDREILEHIREVFEKIKDEYSAVEGGMTLDVKSIESEENRVLKEEYSKMICDLLVSLPHGVLVMSQEVPDLVKTSTNLATVSLDRDEVEITMMTRSSSHFDLLSTRKRIRTIAENFGGEVEESDAYPGWEPDIESDILKLSKDVYKETLGGDPVVEALHAGLETGIIGQKFEGMDMISFGATLEGAHTPSEKVKISTVEKLWTLVRDILKEFAEKHT